MRKFIALIVLLASVQTVNACCWECMEQLKIGVQDQRMPIPSSSPFYKLDLTTPARPMIPVLHTPFATLIWVDGWRGGLQTFRYDHHAYFCRMESHTQRKYGVKFSIHAGDYRE